MEIDELKEKRLELGATQMMIAEMLGITRGYMSECENHKANPSKLLLLAYECVLRKLLIYKKRKKNEKK